MTWRLLRTKDNLDDDPPVESLDALLAGPGAPLTAEDILSNNFISGTIERIVFTFLNTAGQYVVGDRGSFCFQYIEVFFERGGSGQILLDTIVPFDSVIQEGGVAYRQINSPPNTSVINGTIRSPGPCHMSLSVALTLFTAH